MTRSEQEERIAQAQREAQAERDKLKERHGKDRELERETQTVRPHADPPPRAGITGPGSGADGEGLTRSNQ